MEPFNPFRPEVIADPYPHYRRLREADPVHWSDLLDAWVLTRYDDVSFVLTDRRFSANRRLARNRYAVEALKWEADFGPFARAPTMLGTDPPEHTRLRRLVSKAFTVRAVESLRPRIQALVEELLDSLEERGQFDIVADLAYPLPVIVIAEMLGIPHQDRDAFKRWSDDVAATLVPLIPDDVRERARRSIEEMAAYFRDIMAVRRRQPRDDLISGLLAAEEQGQVLSEDEVLSVLMLLLVAGNETTTNFIGNAVYTLLRHPDQLQALRQEPGLVRSAVEELLRYESPAQATTRIALEDVEIRGKTVRQWQVVFAVLGAANRDPAVFPEPDRLDLARDPNPHVAFGDGIHFCLGAPLARAESQIALTALLQRFPHLHLLEERPEWGPNYILRGLRRLPVALD